MPGIVKLDLNLGDGGQGAGRKRLENHAAQKNGGRRAYEQIAVRLLLQGPKHITEISHALGGKISRAYNVMTSLRKQGFSETAGQGIHQLSARGRAAVANAQGAGAGVSPPLLPAPVSHGPGGRASPGSGNKVLRAALARGTLSVQEMRAFASANGISAKSISGVITRAKDAGLIKKNGTGYELTAKGHKIELGTHAHG
jgi:predicted transcriptional regulator